MSINKFDKPTKIVDSESSPLATSTMITRLIMLEPGTIQSHPDMGVGIVSRYRYMNSEDIDQLKDDIQDQVTKYLPNLHDVNVEVTDQDQSVRITLTSNGLVYIADIDKTTRTLSEL